MMNDKSVRARVMFLMAAVACVAFPASWIIREGRAGFSQSDNLIIYNKKGMPVAEIGADERGNAYLKLRDEAGTERASIDINLRWAVVEVKGVNGKKRVELGAYHDGTAVLRLWGEAGEEQGGPPYMPYVYLKAVDQEIASISVLEYNQGRSLDIEALGDESPRIRIQDEYGALCMEPIACRSEP